MEEQKFEAIKQRPPHHRGPEEKVSLKVPSLSTDKSTAAFVVYLFYKNNFLTRHVLAKMIDMISEDKTKTEDIFKYLVEEAAKA